MESSWIKILSALLTPTIAIVGTIIGILQWIINQKRLQHELFDRRIRLYEIVTAHLANAVTHGYTDEEIMRFLRDTKHARFIFNKEKNNRKNNSIRRR